MILGRLFSALVVLVATVAVLFMLLRDGVLLLPGCERTVSVELPSPDGQYLATVTEVGCGVFTREVTTVWLWAPGTLRFPWEDARVFTYTGWPSGANVTWVGERSLVIEHTCTSIGLRREVWREVQISYVQRELPGARCYPRSDAARGLSQLATTAL